MLEVNGLPLISGSYLTSMPLGQAGGHRLAEI